MGEERKEKRAKGTVDAGSQANVMDAVFWVLNERSLGELQESRTWLKVADGKATRCMGSWTGRVRMGRAVLEGRFEVFDSGGAFEVLLGKPWLTQSQAVQSFIDDSLFLVPSGVSLPNGYPLTEQAYEEEENGVEGSVKPEEEEVSVDGEEEEVREAKVEEEETREVKVEEELREAREYAEVGVQVEGVEQDGETANVDEQEPEKADEATDVIEDEPEKVDEAASVVEEPGKVDEAEEPERPPPKEQLRRSTRLKNRKENKKNEAKWNGQSNVFWVDEVLLLKLEEELGMERGAGGMTEIKEDGRCEAERELDRVAERAERALLRGLKAERVARKCRKRMESRKEVKEVLELEEQSKEHSAHLPETPSPRRTDPFAENRVKEILSKVTIGPDLTQDERIAVEDLVREYADIFALDLCEVLPVKTHSHKLDIPPNTKFPTRAGSRPLSPAQKSWLHRTLDEMERANIIRRVPHGYPTAVSPTNVVPKPGGADEPSLEYLQLLANEACIEAGIPIRYPQVNVPPHRPATKEEKLRLVHNFAAVNNVTKVPPFPMGDLAAKQCNVAGFRFVNTIDFASGFNALAMEENSIKYTGFHIEGRGHYVYLCMPFGLTGAPTSFCEMLADALSDLLGDGTEIWMDDICSAFNEHAVGLTKTRALFQRCREQGLSVAPAKTYLFMSEAVFAGAKVSIRGVQPDRRKVQAILEWPEPTSVLEVMGFLGLTGAFRSKIRDYARIARPLSGLTHEIRMERAEGVAPRKGDYKRALRDSPVALAGDARLAFIELKLALTSDPVLRAPVYDDRPFIITTDGSKFGFGAMISQKWVEVDRNGVEKQVAYPIAFASKRTSRSEENYAPFLLEFAALKFALDSFESIVSGQSVELETDCKALADLLGNRKPNSAHERWRESVIAHKITAVRHRPGVENPICDALSRKWQYRGGEEGEGRNETVDAGWEASRGLAREVYMLVEDTEAEKVLKRFEDDVYFRDIVQYLVLGTAYSDDMTPGNTLRAQKRASHRAVGFEVAEGKLWRVGGKGSHHAPRVECIPRRNRQALALAAHEAGGHFGRDLTILALQRKYFWPALHTQVVEAVTSCPRCQNFGPKLISALLAPITRARPFDLLCGDYLSLPVGSGGFKTVLLLVDVYSRFTFAFATRNAGTGTYTVECLDKICNTIMTPSSFMSDNGSHFDCQEVASWAEQNRVTLIPTPTYTPSVNGLVEDANKILIGHLRTLCSPDVGEVHGSSDRPAAPPTKAWPSFLQTAVRQMNDRILPSLGYSPRELMTGILTSDQRQESGSAIARQHAHRAKSEAQTVDVNLALSYALRTDGEEMALRHARERKRRFDKGIRTLEAKPGQLVQRYDARWDNTHSTMRKMVPKWSDPLRIKERLNNSYVLENLKGDLVSRATHARHLRLFHPRPHSELDEYRGKEKEMPAPDLVEKEPVIPGLEELDGEE